MPNSSDGGALEKLWDRLKVYVFKMDHLIQICFGQTKPVIPPRKFESGRKHDVDTLPLPSPA